MAGDDYPAELVKAKFLKLDSHHIEFVMDCLRDNTTKVRNIKQYLRAMLFNAPSHHQQHTMRPLSVGTDNGAARLGSARPPP